MSPHGVFVHFCLILSVWMLFSRKNWQRRGALCIMCLLCTLRCSELLLVFCSAIFGRMLTQQNETEPGFSCVPPSTRGVTWACRNTFSEAAFKWWHYFQICYSGSGQEAITRSVAMKLVLKFRQDWPPWFWFGFGVSHSGGGHKTDRCNAHVLVSFAGGEGQQFLLEILRCQLYGRAFTSLVVRARKNQSAL